MFEEGFRDALTAVMIPGELVGVELSARFFDQVDFLLLNGAPEEAVGGKPVVFAVLHAFGDEEVLPERALVVAEGKRVQVLDDGIADAVVVEVDLPVFADLVAQVPAETVQAKDDERFFQQFDVTGDRVLVDADEAGQFVVRYFLSELQGQRAQEFFQYLRLSDARDREHVFVEVAGAQFLQDFARVIALRDHFRIHSEYESFFQLLFRFEISEA